MFIATKRSIAFGVLLYHMALSGQVLADTQIPDDIHGVWQLTTQGQAPTCLEKDTDIRLSVRARRIDFHEGICMVQSMELKAGNVLQLQAYCEQEDSDWISHQEWRLEEVGSLPYLNIRSLDPSNPYEVLYGLCPTLAVEDVPEDIGIPSQDHTLCYRGDMSELAIRPKADGTADIEIESAQGNAHICSLVGTASPTSDGYQYSARLENGSQCELSIVLDGNGGVTFKDPDWTCKQFHCGARASFEHIEFQAEARIPCN